MAARLALVALLAAGCAPSPSAGKRPPVSTTVAPPPLPTTAAATSSTTTSVLPAASHAAPPAAPPGGQAAAPPSPLTPAHPGAEAGGAAEGMPGQEVTLACIRRWESGGRYGAASRSGRHRGAYQFDRRTWDALAARHRPDLVGVDPAAASPADQDHMAALLLAERGLAPWPTPARRCA